jgi:type II secretory pathway pseudopilin PulG
LTLLELLVVLAILGVLFALLLPAIQQARTAAARAAGANQLRQLALAVHQYQGQNGALPDFTTTIGRAPGNLPISSVFTKLLPFLEQESLYRDVLANGLAAAAVAVPLFLSPLDGPTGPTEGGTSYVANDLVFGAPGRTLTASFPDGTGQTILFTERLMRCGSGQEAAFNVWAIVVNSTPVGKNLRTLSARLSVQTPPQIGTTEFDCIPGGASSPDRAGIRVALGDGAVRMVSQAAAWGLTGRPDGLRNWQAALTPAGGEVLGPDW